MIKSRKDEQGSSSNDMGDQAPIILGSPLKEVQNARRGICYC